MSDSTNRSEYAFGEPEPVLSNNIIDSLGVIAVNDHYIPPVSLPGLAKLLKANAHHGTIQYFKRNMMLKHFVPNQYLSRQDFAKLCYEQEVFGNCYLQKIYNRLGQLLRLRHLPTIRQRKMIKKDTYGWLDKQGRIRPYKPNEVIHLTNYDVSQGIYGIPEYLGAIHSILLNEDATLFRRKYFKNGAHMGYIFYTNDPNIDPKTEEKLKVKIRESKGVGNFRSMYINIPNGNEHSIKLIPVGDIATKDEFQRIKDISRNDIISAGRVPPALAGIMPENVGGFGDIEKISKVYFDNEILPKQEFYKTINDLLGIEVIQFNNPDSSAD